MTRSARRLCSDAEAIGRGFGGPECARRRQVLHETLAAFESADPPDSYRHLALMNLERWRMDGVAAERPLRVEVHSGDWGEVTRSLTIRHGRCFAVLNMANAYVPGGAYVEGAAAQEENMFRRTDCHFSIDERSYDHLQDRYLLPMTRKLDALDGRVYLDVQHPRVCVRGAEDRSRPDLGYPWLPADQVFPFYELRAAAKDLRDGSPLDAPDARRRIAAQLDTLLDHQIRHAVFGAFGCGAFRNPASPVALIYREEIMARAGSFDVVALAIRSAGYGRDNFTPFSEVFAHG